MPALLVRGGAVWQLVGLITRRSQVQILPPLPTSSASFTASFSARRWRGPATHAAVLRRGRESFQGFLRGKQQFWRVCNSDLVDLSVIQLRIAMRENISETNNVACVGYRLGDGRGGPVEIAHRLPTALHHSFHSCAGLLVGEVRFETQPGCEAYRCSRVMLDIFQVDAGVTLRHRSETCSDRCNSEVGGCGSLASPPNQPGAGIMPPAPPSDRESLRNCPRFLRRTRRERPHRYAQDRSRPGVWIRTLAGFSRRGRGTSRR